MLVVAVLFVVYGVQQWRRDASTAPAVPAVRAIAVSYGNAVQMGIPMAAAMFGEAGLGIHLMLVSVHGLILLSVLTALVELDLARAQSRQQAGARNDVQTELVAIVRYRGSSRSRSLAANHLGLALALVEHDDWHVSPRPAQMRLHDLQHECCRHAGVEGIAAHINAFWEPRMRRHFFEVVDDVEVNVLR